jgi:hypothetical protein
MIRILYIVLILFILVKTVIEIMAGDLSGFSSGRSLHGYTVNIQDNPIEYLFVIGLRLGAILLLITLFRNKSEKD